jgi:hypothetical protein
MSILRRTAILVWIAFFVSAGCTGGTHVDEVSNSPQDGSARQRSPEVVLALADAREAEVLALCLSESLHPMPDLVNALLYKLAAIRSAYGYDALVRTRPRTAWTGEIEIEFDSATSHEFSLGNYFFWNDLNDELGPVRVIPLEFGRARLLFARLFNPCIASEMYAQLPGIVHAQPVFDPTDGPEIFVGISELYGYTYLFRYAHGDCERRCANEEFFYFRFYEANPVLVGRWNPADGGPPVWWAEVEEEWIMCSCFPQFLDAPDSGPGRTRTKSR